MKKSSLTSNKVMAAILIALSVAWIAGKISDSAVEPTTLAKDSYIVDTSAIASAAPTSAAPAPVEIPPIAPLLAKADPVAGEKDAKVCATCHSFGKGEPAKMGPNLYGIVGLKHDHMEGFNYSDAMKALASQTWTFEALNHFLAGPKAEVPGTKMTFAGIKNDKDRADVIDWLRTLSEHPEPLPK
jgi:cytochrome c